MSKELFSSAAPDAGPGKPSQSLRVVVADDDRDTVRTLMLLLREEGHDVYGAHTGQQALDQILKVDPDVVLMDIALPDMSGYEVARKVRARHGDDLLMIGLSGVYKKGADRRLATLCGFDHYLLKPYDPPALLALMAPRPDASAP